MNFNFFFFFFVLPVLLLERGGWTVLVALKTVHSVRFEPHTCKPFRQDPSTVETLMKPKIFSFVVFFGV